MAKRGHFQDNARTIVDSRDRNKKQRRQTPPPIPPPITRHSPSRSSSSGSSLDDDTVGHYPAILGQSVIADRYEIQSELGTGTFGKVFNCHDRKHRDKVALKIVRSLKRYVESAHIEANVLNRVYDQQKRDRKDYCVKMFSQFPLGEHYCMVFETLGISVYDLIKRNEYIGLPLHHVRDIARQLFQALDFLESMNLIHTDLKLENILFQNTDVLQEHTVTKGDKQCRILIPQNIKVKLIDFGGATFDNEHKSTIVNTRQYRGPEVTLEAGWSFPSDIWSIGCIVAEIYAGELFFNTHDDLEHLALMEQSVSLFPYSLLNRSRKDQEYFHRNGYVRVEDLPPDSRDFVRRAPSIREFFSLNPEDNRSGLVELMQAVFELEPRRRATARQALNMPFFADNHSPHQHQNQNQNNHHQNHSNGNNHRPSHGEKRNSRDAPSAPLRQEQR